MRVGDRDWYVDVGLLNQHRVGGWEGDDTEHLSVIIWQEESTRGTMSPPMSALIVAKDASNDLLGMVLRNYLLICFIFFLIFLKPPARTRSFRQI